MKKYFDVYFGSSVPASKRVLFYSCLGSIAGSLIVTILLLLSAAKSSYIIVATTLILLNILLAGISFFGKIQSKISVCCTILWNCVMFPFWFFCFDGEESGQNLYFLLGLFLCFALHKGYVRIWLFSLSLILDVVAYMVAHYAPGMMQPMAETASLSGMLISTIVTGFFIVGMTYLITSENQKQQEENALMRQRIERLSDFDPMTGIYGEKAFRGILESYYAEAVPYGVILFDVDYLAVINSKYGAEAGNRVLQDIAAILKDVMESDRLVAKCFGGTFALVIKEENTAYLFDLAQAIRSRIENEVVIPDADWDVTVSGGICCPPSAESPHQVMNGAFENLQRAKKAGRNCVVSN